MKNTTPPHSDLTDLIRACKCRKGKAAKITASGAYWLALPPITIRRFGGDGIGQDTADCTHTLELRHYRDGKVRIMAHVHSWHQNHGNHNEYHSMQLNHCTTAEDCIVTLKCQSIDGRSPCSDYFQEDLIAALVGLGLPEYEIPSPDDEPPANPD